MGSLVEHLPQLFSSDPSVQSFSPLQKSPRSMQLPSPQAKNPSWHSGSSVTSSGLTLRSLFLSLQFFTASFQSHVCFSMSKYRPAGHRMACRPWDLGFRIFAYQFKACQKLTEVVHWMTSRQASPSLATNLNHSPASLSLHSSCSKVSSFFLSPDLSSCRLTRIAFAGRGGRKGEQSQKNGKAIKGSNIDEEKGQNFRLLGALELFYVSSRNPFTFFLLISCDVVDFFFPNASHFFYVLFVKFKKQTWDFTKKKKWADGVDDSAAFTSKCAESAFDFFFASPPQAVAALFFLVQSRKQSNWLSNILAVIEARKIIG